MWTGAAQAQRWTGNERSKCEASSSNSVAWPRRKWSGTPKYGKGHGARVTLWETKKERSIAASEELQGRSAWPRQEQQQAEQRWQIQGVLLEKGRRADGSATGACGERHARTLKRSRCTTTSWVQG